MHAYTYVISEVNEMVKQIEKNIIKRNIHKSSEMINFILLLYISVFEMDHLVVS